MPPCGLQAGTEEAFLRARSRMERVEGCVRKARACVYLDSHVLEAVPCRLHYFAKTEYGAERICYRIINARFEVGGGDVGKNIPPKVGRKQKIKARKILKQKEPEVSPRHW